MAGAGKRENLGRGLSALLGDDGDVVTDRDRSPAFATVPIEFLHPGRYQPRHPADDAQIDDLAQSIRAKGILQPILVRRHGDEANSFEIIAGERRWRAAQLARLHEVPVVVKELTDREALEIALIENLQREDLSPLEEAEGYLRLMEEFIHTQENLARSVGKSRSHVANMMRLLGLPDPVKDLLGKGALTAGHARALLNTEDPVALALRVVKRGLNVRQTEALVQRTGGAKTAARRRSGKDSDTLVLERDLETLLGLKVEIRSRGNRGTLTLHYGSLAQLDGILHRLGDGSHGARVGRGEIGRTDADPDHGAEDVE